ncbi:MAG: response regulator [Candidatus Latescibacterota bacterium]|nr:response regulator [Candidatus Latescibacterota bacterium]OPX24189.1 MAG: response regulator [Candidatus Latescibacteria bacterium 4484_107]RKY70665.1 MAG: response regulator [Candidatus Latescibacterota bacterium]
MKKVVLVADDSSTVRKFVSFAVKSMGHRVITATDGMDALEKLPDAEVDLVITDLNMPNMNGYELIDSLRKSERYRETPIIILSSESGEEDKKKGKELGADSYMVKPFNAKRIQYEISKYIE